MGLLRKIGAGLGTIAGTIIGGPAGGAVGGTLGGQIGGIFGGGGGGSSQIPGIGGGITQASMGLPQLQGGGMPTLPQSIAFNNAQQNGTYSGDISTLLGGDRLVMEPQLKTIHSAPPGWVIVDMPDGSGKKAVRKEIARCLGLWKSRSKPPISASDWKKLKTANRVKNKAKKIAQTADFKCVKK